MQRRELPQHTIKNEIRAGEQIADYYEFAADSPKYAILIASFFLPGPEDAIWAALGSKYGLKIAGEGAGYVLKRLGKILKPGTKEFDKAVATVRHYKIAYHAKHEASRIHFPNKTVDEIKDMIDDAVANGVKTIDPLEFNMRLMNPNYEPQRYYHYYEKTGVLVSFDGKGGGTAFRPDKIELRQWIDKWNKGLK